MLTCDIIYAAAGRYDLIVVVSDDDDALPAIRTATLKGTPVLRLHPNPSNHASFPASGAPLMEQTL